MPGHNRRSQIKHKKSAADSEQSQIFSKLLSLISVAAKKTKAVLMKLARTPVLKINYKQPPPRSPLCRFHSLLSVKLNFGVPICQKHTS